MEQYKDILPLMTAYAEKHHVPIIQQEGAELLIKTVRLSEPSSILEIGTAIGYSTLLMAANTAVHTKVVTIELNQDRADTAKKFLKDAGLLDRVKILIGDAGTILPELRQQFDLVFIDAAKGQYLDYLNKVLDKLLPHAVVVADNVLFRGLVTQEGIPPRRYRTIVNRLREYLNFVNNDHRFATTVYTQGDGIAISIYQGANECEKT